MRGRLNGRKRLLVTGLGSPSSPSTQRLGSAWRLPCQPEARQCVGAIGSPQRQTGSSASLIDARARPTDITSHRVHPLPMDINSPTSISVLATTVRMPVVARVVFYAITISAPILAVMATSFGGEAGSMLRDLSWYALMLGLLAFLLMVFINFLSSQDEADDEDLDEAAQLRRQAERNSVF